MIQEYVLVGLDCAHCANKIEKAVCATDNVEEATLNFVTGILRVDLAPAYQGNIMPDLEKIVHQYEPDVTVRLKTWPKVDKHGYKEAGCGNSEGKKDGIIAEYAPLITGAALFAIGILLNRAFAFPLYIPLGVFIVSYILLGGKVVWRALRNISKGQVFDENFLMSVATIGAFAIGDYTEAVAVMLFYQIGELFQELAIKRSKKSITALMDIRPDFANLRHNNDLVKVTPDSVSVGDIIVVKPGEKIPLDGTIIEGKAMLDTMALTGESVPRKATSGDTVLSGCINQNGVLTIEVTKPFGESTVAKIIDLVENASSKKAPTENFITTFSRYYTPAVVGMAALIAVLPPLFSLGAWTEWINRGLIFLVISCPCALVISIPLGYFGGIGGASRKGILIKGSNFLEALTKLDIVVFDKTGTLTKGVFEVSALQPANGFSAETLLEKAAVAEAFSKHPIALSIRKVAMNIAHGKEIDQNTLSDYEEISGQGIQVKAGETSILAGNEQLLTREGVPFTPTQIAGTKVYIAVNKVFIGSIVISDEIKADSSKAIAELKTKGVRKTVMLTGDNPEIAKAIADKLNLDEYHAGLLPGQKVVQLERLNTQKRAKTKLAFVGDGINDAPVLARADIGIAMGGLGSDAAIEAADIVIMTDEPSKLATAIDIAKVTKRIVWQNITFALGIKGCFLILGAFGISTMWEAVFADVGVCVLAIFNAMRIIKIN
ncbi:MAG: cadmium-translocating P-type ATPase [Treponema sp.]|jgi:Cd2+/Zn2+-exporting ATPase|nr:cadmium-translocating P-type ATPase [Treponema sp.]